MKITRKQLKRLIREALQETFWGPGMSSSDPSGMRSLMGPKFKNGEEVVVQLPGSPPFKGTIHSFREGPGGLSGPAYIYDIEVSPGTYGTVSLPGFGPEVIRDVPESSIDFSSGDYRAGGNI
jgi:hypothetical protein